MGGRAMAKGTVGKQEHFVSCMAGGDQASNQAHSDIAARSPPHCLKAEATSAGPPKQIVKLVCILESCTLPGSARCQPPCCPSVAAVGWGSCCLLLENASGQGDCGRGS